MNVVAARPAPASAAAPTINWTNCLRTKPWVREQWAREHGLEGVDGPEFDRHLDAVWERIARRPTDCSRPQRPAAAHEARAPSALGWSFKTITRNIDAARYTPEQRRLHRLRRPLRRQAVDDAHLPRATRASTAPRSSSRCFAERVLVEGGRAAGVEAIYADPETGRGAHGDRRAPRVVVACGALESPGAAAALRASAARPSASTCACTRAPRSVGNYGEDQQAWWGAPQAGARRRVRRHRATATAS